MPFTMKFISVPESQQSLSDPSFLDQIISVHSINFWILCFFGGLCILSYLQFGWDKYCAIRQRWRISENTLLLTAFLGGALGAKIGQRAFRHKTTKEPFRTSLQRIFFWNFALYAIAFSPQGKAAVTSIALAFFNGMQ
ncbi:hypothetical protein RC74_10565 [Falsihalocynthiibacter arcticus]|uniref:DUF1294 domain-containing protein n=2 Tax=Falsihalocynthiibacter arcticus TaxID=1579316 RepID=A0A126V1A3_9RHOB|nr:hypothetical protein RC74_10565 [Falsihalocynthiibacter arcticus]